jgi:hypothetical protein
MPTPTPTYTPTPTHTWTPTPTRAATSTQTPRPTPKSLPSPTGSPASTATTLPLPSPTMTPAQEFSWGMVLFSTGDNNWELSADFGDWVDDLLANGFTQLRIDIPSWDGEAGVAISKTAVTAAVAKGAQVIWGVSFGDSGITAANWNAYSAAVQVQAQWAQDNGVYEFQIGNELELNHDGSITDAQIRANLKTLATAVQGIFTRGNISYSFDPDAAAGWIAAGRGDIDLMAFNCYRGGGGVFDDNWKTVLTALVTAFGPDHTYVSELGPSATSLADYSADETIQAAAVAEMIEYIRASGMTRAFNFNYYDDSRPFGPAGFGALKANGTYRKLWDVLKAEKAG